MSGEFAHPCRGPAAALAVALALVHGPAAAAAPQPAVPGQRTNVPIEIEADNGIEWQRDARAYVARGNVRAKQGDVRIRADTLTAHYREGKTGGTEVWRFDAIGAVRIDAPGQSAFGDSAVYHVDEGVLVLRGRDLRLIAERDRITARDSLEYWDQRRLAVARGNVTVTHEDIRVKAQTMTAHFTEGADQATRMTRIDVFDDVQLISPCETVRAARGVYDITSGVANLTGSVTIIRGSSQLNGESAEVNLKTGVSTLGGHGGATGVVRFSDLKSDNGKCARRKVQR